MHHARLTVNRPIGARPPNPPVGPGRRLLPVLANARIERRRGFGYQRGCLRLFLAGAFEDRDDNQRTLNERPPRFQQMKNGRLARRPRAHAHHANQHRNRNHKQTESGESSLEFLAHAVSLEEGFLPPLESELPFKFDEGKEVSSCRQNSRRFRKRSPTWLRAPLSLPDLRIRLRAAR